VGMSKDEPYIFVVTSDGEFLNYKINFYHGGEGKLVKQYSYCVALWIELMIGSWILLMRDREHLRRDAE
jgi:hypothetical protein